MGWLFCANSRKQLVDDLRSENHVIASKLIGNNLWLVYDCPNGKREIVLFMLAKAGGSYGYKNIGETMHPFSYNCPLELLEVAQPAPENSHSIEWRQKVREFHITTAKNKACAVVGAIVELYGKRYELVENAGRKGWYVVGVDDGLQYRLKVSQWKHATVLGQKVDETIIEEEYL